MLSPQQLVDCSTVNCWGCKSGWPQFALDYVVDNGIADWEEYPYVDRRTSINNQTCTYDESKMSVGGINSSHTVQLAGNAARFIQKMINLIYVLSQATRLY